MNFTEYFRQPGNEKALRGSRGQQSDWMPLGELTLDGPQFLLVDANFVPSEKDGLLIACPPGRYGIAVHGASFGSDRRIARLRVSLGGAHPAQGSKIGETWTDTAVTGVCDYQQFKAQWDRDAEKAAQECEAAMADRDMEGVWQLEGGPAVAYVNSGFGDGTFPVFELIENGQRVGFEVEFIGDSEAHPFGDAPAPPSGAAKPASSLRDGISILQGLFKVRKDQAIANFRAHLAQVRSKAMPLRIYLTPTTDSSWRQIPSAASLFAFLSGEKFEEAGIYAVSVNAKMQIAGFVDSTRMIYASILRLGERSDLTFHCLYEDGIEVEFTQTPRTLVAGPPRRTRENFPELNAEDLLAKFLANRPAKPLVPTSVEGFAKSVEEGYCKDQAWLAERGGQTLEDLRRRFSAAGKLPSGPEGETRLTMERFYSGEKALCNWLRAQRDLPFKLDEVLDSLVIIHDEMPLDLLANAYWSGTDDTAVTEEAFTGSLPRESFARVVAQRGNRMKKVFEKITPLAADFYLPQ